MATLIALLAIALVLPGCSAGPRVWNVTAPGPQVPQAIRTGEGPPPRPAAPRSFPPEMAPRQSPAATSPVGQPGAGSGGPAVVEVPGQTEASLPKAPHAEAHERESAGKGREWERVATEVDRLLEQRQYRKAIGLVGTLIEQRPGPAAHFNRGVASYHLGDYPAALKDFERALFLDPTFAQAHFGLGVIYLTLGELEEMSQHFQQVFRLAPESPEAQVLRREQLVDRKGG